MKTRKIIMRSAIGGALLAAATISFYNKRRTIPLGVDAVRNFKPNKYLGKWYEIARLDFHFEKDLDNTTAEYSLNEDGTIQVVNRGFNYKKDLEEMSVGIAKFVESPKVGKLKVSFFGPFYAGYNVVAIDKHYRYALVAGRNHNYLWLLSRYPYMPDDIKRNYIQKAKHLGYNTKKLIWVEHD